MILREQEMTAEVDRMLQEKLHIYDEDFRVACRNVGAKMVGKCFATLWHNTVSKYRRKITEGKLESLESRQWCNC